MSKRKFAVATVATSMLGLLTFSPLVGAQSSNGNVTICHATGSQTNPYVKNSPNKNAVVNAHNNHQNDEDIIPPFDYNDNGTTKSFPGKNWDAQGQAIYNNGCVVPAGGRGGQVLGSSSDQVVTPQGGVGAGAGGGSRQTGALVGLIGSLVSLGSGVLWLRRRAISRS